MDSFTGWGLGTSIPSPRCAYEAIVATSTPSLRSERDVMTRFVTWMRQWDAYIKTVYYWYAEIRFWAQAVQRQSAIGDTTEFGMSMEDWIDLCSLFRDAPILVKNAWNFKLKTVSKYMRMHGMISIELPNACQSGTESLVIARQYFERHDTASKQEAYDILRAYNHFDCTVMYEMVTFLQDHVRQLLNAPVVVASSR